MNQNNLFVQKTGSSIFQILLFFTIILMISISCIKRDNLQDFTLRCDTVDMDIDTSYRYTPLCVVNPDGTPVFSEDTWKWTTSNDTIIIWGYLDSGGEAGISRYMFFKKACNCIDLLYVLETFCDDVVNIDENGNLLEDPCNTYEINNVDLIRQKYVEDSLLVGKVGGNSFWMEFSPQYRQDLP